MSKICLVRHGETEWNKLGILQGHSDIPLNKTGKIQAESAGEYLKKDDWKYIYSSPLARSYGTAQIISEIIQLPDIRIEESLKERNYGKAEGLSEDERNSLYPEKPYPDEEPWAMLRDRAMKVIVKIAASHADENIIVVSHGGIINSVIHTLTKGEFGSGITKLENCCLTMLVNSKSGLSIRYYNFSGFHE